MYWNKMSYMCVDSKCDLQHITTLVCQVLLNSQNLRVQTKHGEDDHIGAFMSQIVEAGETLLFEDPGHTPRLGVFKVTVDDS